MIYVDDGAFIFESRTDIKIGITLLSDKLAHFGLGMHIGTGKFSRILNAYSYHPRSI